MRIFDYMIMTIAPSLTLGIVVFLAKNWFLERLKNSIKHEYDIALEKFKGEMKSSHDKELEDLKALLKKQTDINLEDYRFQIELRKKWLDDFRNLCSAYLDKLKENVDRTNKFIMHHELALGNVDNQLDNYKETLDHISQLYAELRGIKFKIELLVYDCDLYGEKINNHMNFIEEWIRNTMEKHFVGKIPFDYKSNEAKTLLKKIDEFKNDVKILIIEKSANL